MRNTTTRRTMNVFIYRPDRVPIRGIIPELCFTASGKNILQVVEEQKELEEFLKQKKKEVKIPEHKVLDYWR